MNAYAWTPTEAVTEKANVTRLMRAHGIDGLEELRRRSVANIDWFWDAVVKDLGLPFTQPYSGVRDSSAGIEWTTWFTDGHFNAAQACIGRWLGDPASAEVTALIHEDEAGAVRRLSYRELAEAVAGLADGLRARGIGHGDVVGVYMPMVPEAVAALYAIAAVGAV
jgi:acetyl-CoA synthetase